MIRMISAAAAALTLICGPALAEPAVGTWQTEPGDAGAFAHVRIAPCGAQVCGTITRAFDASGSAVQSDTVGKRIVWDMTPDGNGSYSGGRIWAPDRDKVYRSKMELNGSRLKVSGCVGPVCRSQTWQRVN
ncbi:MAG: DUF2147 domain-containing protein [Pseudomonadota bacterium]